MYLFDTCHVVESYGVMIRKYCLYAAQGAVFPMAERVKDGPGIVRR